MNSRANSKSSSAAVRTSASENLPEVIDTGGRVHPFWDQSVLFVANLLALFFGNEDQTRLLQSEIQGADSYGGRLLPILNLLYRGGNNVLLLERSPNPAMQEYFASELRLGLPKIEILSHHDYLALGAHESSGSGGGPGGLAHRFDISQLSFVDGYVTDRTLTAIADSIHLPTVSSVRGSYRGNNKSLLYEALVAADLPVFDTYHAAFPEDVAPKISRLKQLGYRSAVIKSPLGASGIGIKKVSVDQDLRETVPKMMFFEGPCMVQGWLEPGVQKIESITSPSVQMFLNESHVALYDVTNQFLSDQGVHQGNESPPGYLANNPDLRAELFRQAGIAGSWLHEQGYRGTASIDFLVAHRHNDPMPAVHVCEINARVTGATYPSVLARHFRPDGAWLMRNISLTEPVRGRQLLESLKQHECLFRAGDDQGVLPINLNLGGDDAVLKGQFLCLARSVPECHEILVKTEKSLGVPWRFDRD